jgi:hypothetical protein
MVNKTESKMPPTGAIDPRRAAPVVDGWDDPAVPVPLGDSPGATPNPVVWASPGKIVDRKTPLEVMSTLPVAVTTTMAVLTEVDAAELEEAVELDATVPDDALEDVDADVEDEEAEAEDEEETAPEPGR